MGAPAAGAAAGAAGEVAAGVGELAKLNENVGLGGCAAAGVVWPVAWLGDALAAFPNSTFGASPAGFGAEAPKANGPDNENPFVVAPVGALDPVTTGAVDELVGAPKTPEPVVTPPNGEGVGTAAGFAAAPKGL